MEIRFKIVAIFVLLLDLITRPFFWLKTRIPCRKLPPIKDPLLYTSATKLAELIRKKQVSSLEVVESYINRIKEVDPLINAVVEEHFTGAIAEAKLVDGLLKGLNEESIEQLKIEKPLLGVPITVKESCFVSGTKLFVDPVPRIGTTDTEDCHVITLIRCSGAIIISISINNLFSGRPNNPYCLHRTSGGSSGGEAALISSGASVIGIASDIAGSIRIPALFSGVFGHKPTTGLVSVHGYLLSVSDENFAKYLTIGPLTRYSEDLATMLKIMAGSNSYVLNLDIPVDVQKIKVLYMPETEKSLGMIPIDDETQQALMKAVDYLKNQSHSDVQEVTFDAMNQAVEMAVSIFFGTQPMNKTGDEDNKKIRESPYVSAFKFMLEIGIPRSSYNKYYVESHEFKKSIREALGDNGVLLYPTFTGSAPYNGQLYFKLSGFRYTILPNALGFPSTQVPLGFNSHGLPIGIQVIAAPNQDRLCFAVARELEKGFGGWVSPCSMAY